MGKICYVGLDREYNCDDCIFCKECPEENTYKHDINLSHEEYYIRILKENQEEEIKNWDY